MATKKTSAQKGSTAPVSKTAAKKIPAKKTAAKRASTKKSAGRKYSPEASAEVGKELHDMHRGQLHIGKSGKKVTNPKQAIAIALSEARRAGEKVPPNPNDSKN